MAITYGTPVYVATSNSIEITVASGTQALLFFSANEDAAGTVPQVSGISNGSQSATFPTGARATRGTGPSNGAEIWVVSNPTPGTTTWTVSWVDTPDRNRSIICVPVLSGADDAIYEAVGQSTSGSSPISTAITTTTAGCDILGIVTHDATSGNFSASNGQSTLLNEANNGISGGGGAETSRVLVSQYSAGAAGTYNLAWTNNGTVTRLCQVLIAIVPGAPPEPNPKIETLVEPFDGSELPEGWEIVFGDDVAVSGGALVLAGANDVAYVRREQFFDLTESAVVVDWSLDQNSPDDFAQRQMDLLSLGGTGHGYAVRYFDYAGDLAVYRMTGGAGSISLLGTQIYLDTVAASAVRFVRISEASGTTSVAISADGNTWDTLVSEDTDTNGSFDPLAVQLTLRSCGGFVGEAPSTLYVAGVNVLPEEGYELAAASGAVEVAGTAASLLRGLVLAATAGTVAIASPTAALTVGRVLPADPGAITIAASPATFPRGYVVAAGGGVIAVTGQPAALLTGRVLGADTGTVTITGTAATFARGYGLAADSGTATVTGQSAALTRSRILGADTGAITSTGTAASLAIGRVLVASSGTVAVTGEAVDFARGYGLVAESGSLTIAGTAADLGVGRVLAALSGTTTITGHAATLLYTPVGQYTLAADPGTATVTGTAAGLRVDRLLAASPGSIEVAGQSATLATGYGLTAASGAVTVSGSSAVLTRTRVLSADPAAITVTGTAATLDYTPIGARVLVASGGAVEITGHAATLSRTSQIIPLVTTTSTDFYRVRVHQGAATDTTVTHGPIYRVRIPE